MSGHAFPDRYTRWQKGIEGSVSHQRIVSYQFAGLKLLVRFEADGYLEDEVGREEVVEEGARPNNARRRHRRQSQNTSPRDRQYPHSHWWAIDSPARDL
jgi:hypothetical protein